MNTAVSFTMTIAAAFLLAVSLLTPLPAEADDITFIRSDRVKNLDLPFSDVVRVENMLYLSGMLGVDPDRHTLVDGDITAQTRQALKNIQALLEANGSDMNHVAKCTVFLTNPDDWAEMSEVYKTIFQ